MQDVRANDVIKLYAVIAVYAVFVAILAMAQVRALRRRLATAEWEADLSMIENRVLHAVVARDAHDNAPRTQANRQD